MTVYSTLNDEHEGNWQNVQDDCLLCEMEKKTEWYLETKGWVVAEKLGGGPFVVSKEHTTELTDGQWEEMERIVGLVFDEFELVVRMNLVKDHFHAHIVTEEKPDLSGE